MKKSIILSLFLTLISAGLCRAQLIPQLGIKGGLLVSSTDLKFNTSDLLNNFKDESTRAGFEAGIMVRLGLPGRFLLQPEILYNRSTGQFDTDPSLTGAGQLKIRSNWIDVPVMVGWKFLMFRLMAGPSFRFPMNEVFTFGNRQQEIAPRLRNFVMGYQVGAGADLGRLTFDIRFCGNFSDLNNRNIEYNYIPNLKITERRVSFSLGYMILK